MDGETLGMAIGAQVDVQAEGMALSQELVDFIASSPSMFHSVATIRSRLDEAGFSCLREADPWRLERGGSYYVVRNSSSIVAFRVGEALGTHDGTHHFQICASHSDSPTFKLKNVGELRGPGSYLRLNVEAYGGMIDNTWLDRPLSVAGRVLVRDGSRVRSRLVAPDRDLLLIPNVAIHLNREANKGVALNHQVDLCPLFSAGALHEGALDALLAEELGVKPEGILGRDLFLVNREKGRVWGCQSEFVSSPRLDDLQCAFASLKAFIPAHNASCTTVFACFDNEEVGSNTKQGALSTFLHDVLVRINAAGGEGEEGYLRSVASSFLVSCDNAHAVHPNHPECTDEGNRAWLNQGVVVKESANQKYTTDAFSRAVFAALCNRADVPVQAFANRSDSAGGSTLGNLSNMQVSLHAVDMGLPQLAMHSSFETAGVKDTAWGARALRAFYETDLRLDGANMAELC